VGNHPRDSALLLRYLSIPLGVADLPHFCVGLEFMNGA
jgi:hypothetical protein